MQQLTIDLTSRKHTTLGWRGEQALDAGIRTFAVGSENAIVESFLPWSSLSAKGEENDLFSLSIRYFDPKETFFNGSRPVPFASARDRASQLQPHRGFKLQLSPHSAASAVTTLVRRNHYGYLAYDVQVKAADQPAWNGDWESRVNTNGNAFVAELRIPWKTLTDAGLSRERMQMNVNKPLLVSDAQDRVLPLLEHQEMSVHTTEQPRSAKYTVRLHFAELDDVASGQRVFDVLLQGKVVLKEFDVAAETGGQYRSVVKEFSDIGAREVLEIRFVPKNNKHDDTTVPILSGLEMKKQ